MSLRTHFASVSLSASVDQQTGSLSVFDVLEELRAPQVPIQLQSLVISLSMTKSDPDEFNGKMLIHLLTPDGKQHKVGTGEMRFPAEQKRMKALFRFGSFPINAFGAHRFVLSWLDNANVKKGEAILDFEVVQATQIAQGTEPSEKPPFAH